MPYYCTIYYHHQVHSPYNSLPSEQELSQHILSKTKQKCTAHSTKLSLVILDENHDRLEQSFLPEGSDRLQFGRVHGVRPKLHSQMCWTAVELSSREVGHQRKIVRTLGVDETDVEQFLQKKAD